MVEIKGKFRDKDVKKYLKKLQRMRVSSIPQTTRATINDMAFFARKQMQEEIENKFTLRNKYVKNRVVVNKAFQRKIQDMESEAGHTEKFMKLQAEGGIIRARKKRHPIPTDRARIGSNKSKVIRRALMLSRLGNLSGNTKISLFKPKGKKLGVYKILKTKIVMLHDLSKKSVTINKKDWFTPAVNRTSRQSLINSFFIKNARRLLRM